jgi:hypothetical protein
MTRWYRNGYTQIKHAYAGNSWTCDKVASEKETGTYEGRWQTQVTGE